MSDKQRPDLAELQRQLDVAKQDYDRAHMGAQAASREETAARNRLSDAMKALDAAVAEIRDANREWSTPWDKCKPTRTA